MRDFLVMAVILASLPVGLFQPFYGILVYAWISYMYPHLLAWSYAQTAPVAKMAALSVLVGVVLRRNGDLAPLKEREMRSMWALLVFFTISSFFAFYPTDAWEKWQEMVKVILMSTVIAAFITTHRHLRLFLAVVALSLGFYGFKGGLFSLVTRGEFTVWGPGRSIIGANNNLGLALNMCLPIFWYLAKDVKNRWAKRGLLLCFFLTIPAVMFTYSRGSLLGLAVVLAYIVWKSKHRILVLGLALAISVAFVGFLPERWQERQHSIIDYEQDTSAMSRIENWKFCWKLALDRPVTGGGFKFFTMETLNRYAPDFALKYGKAWDTHNIYLGILAGHGFPAFFVFMLMLALTFTSCRWLKKETRDNPDLAWVAVYIDLVQVSLTGWAVNGMFVNMEYFELPFHLVAVVAALKATIRRELAESKEIPAPEDVEQLAPAVA